MQDKKRNTFAGSIGFILAAAGSAVGLGNIWRFPYLAAQYGGGIYIDGGTCVMYGGTVDANIARVNGGGTKVERLYRLMEGKAEAMEFIARAADPYIGVPLKDLQVRRNTLVSVIVRGSKVIVPFGNDHIEDGDHVVIMACESGISDLNEVIRR